MKQHSLYFYALIALALLLAGHLAGLHMGFYYAYPVYYDGIMHLLAGFGVTMFLAAFAKSNFPSLFNHRTLVLGIFIVGVVWELFEIYFNIAGYVLWTPKYYWDTLKDLSFDLIGGIVANLLFVPK